MAAAAEVLQEIHNFFQVCDISKRVACKRLIDNEGFNSLKDFVAMDGGADVLDM